MRTARGRFLEEIVTTHLPAGAELRALGSNVGFGNRAYGGLSGKIQHEQGGHIREHIPQVPLEVAVAKNAADRAHPVDSPDFRTDHASKENRASRAETNFLAATPLDHPSGETTGACAATRKNISRQSFRRSHRGFEAIKTDRM